MELQRQVSELRHGEHLCLVYETDAEQYSPTLPFLQSGLERGECCVYFLNGDGDEVKGLLAGAGIDVAGQVERGALILQTQTDRYLDAKHLDARALVSDLRETAERALASGFSGLRVTGEMSWALGAGRSSRPLLELEGLLNDFYAGSRALAICQYSRKRLGPTIIRDVLRSHPTAIVGDELCSNFFYEPNGTGRGRKAVNDRVDWMITQLRRMRAAELAMRDADGAKSDFLAVISHELRTPLNAIMGYTNLLTDEIAGSLNGKQKQHLERIRVSADHLLELIEEILTFSRIEAGRETIRSERVELTEVAREAAAVVRPAADTAGLALALDLPEEPVWIETDADKLHRILVNLLSNAVKFTERGQVALAASCEGEELVVRVRDTGPGIQPQHLPYIFEPFWQVEEARTREKGGTGLGLSVARRLARLLGGEIGVASTPGEGSTFTLRVPAGSRENPLR